MSKLIKDKEVIEALGILNDGHNYWSIESITKICDTINAPVPLHLIETYRTRLFWCDEHDYNIGNGRELQAKGEGYDKLKPCCKKGEHLGKYVFYFLKDNGDFDFDMENKAVYSLHFNAWLANTWLNLKVDTSGDLGRGSSSRQYGRAIRQWLIGNGYLGRKEPTS